VIPGLLLALASAALINIGFLLQHRGLRRAAAGEGARARLRRAVRDRSWLAGQAIGWLGFITQIVAVAIAPLSLVQAFAAGGLALSVPVAAGMFHHRISRNQVLAVAVIAIGLAALPIGFSTARDRLDTSSLVLACAICAVGGAVVARTRRGWTLAIAAGIFYGIADAAIKAVSLGLHRHGVAAVLSGWTAVAAIGTFLGFLAFQSALERDRSAVAAISLMNALAALVALGCGLGAFGESLGASPGVVAAHLLAIAVVLGGVPVLAAAQAAIVEATDQRDERPAARPVAASPAHGPGQCATDREYHGLQHRSESRLA
jgi:hypothetical protein